MSRLQRPTTVCSPGVTVKGDLAFNDEDEDDDGRLDHGWRRDDPGRLLVSVDRERQGRRVTAAPFRQKSVASILSFSLSVLFDTCIVGL